MKNSHLKILETERTTLRKITTDDAEFILDLLNQPSFIKNIGDRNVRTVGQAREYIESRFTESYKNFGFGFYAVELRSEDNTLADARVSASNMPIGICGFVKRDTLPDVDVGFAFLPQFEKQGYGFETADAMMKYGRNVLNFERILAIVSQGNESSCRLLEKIGLTFERLIKISDDAEELKLYSSSS